MHQKLVQFKDSVRIKRLTPALIHMLNVLYRMQGKYQWLPELVITSINDSKHSDNSRHYKDEAIDIRIHYFKKDEDLDKFVGLLKNELNLIKPYRLDAFTVLVEGRGTPNQHIHVQVNKGETYP